MQSNIDEYLKKILSIKNAVQNREYDLEDVISFTGKYGLIFGIVFLGLFISISLIMWEYYFIYLRLAGVSLTIAGASGLLGTFFYNWGQ